MRPVFAAIVGLTLGTIIGLTWRGLHHVDVVYECGGDRLVGTLFTDETALAVPGKLVLAWDAEGKKKLVSRELFEICAAAVADNGA